MPMDEYYQLARRLKPLDRGELATELRKFHQQTVDQTMEIVLSILGQAEFEDWSFEKVRESVREIELQGTQFAHDRLHLRRCESILSALRERKALIVSKKDVARAYEQGDGVQVDYVNDTTIEISLHPGKFAGR